MGYDVCTTPGPRWFAARSFLREPLQDLAATIQSPPAPSMLALIRLQKLRLDLSRGVLLMTGHVPESGSIHEMLCLAAKAVETSHPAWALRLAALASSGFAVSYSGSGQYGVPNYMLMRGAETERAIGQLGPLFQAAYAERIVHAEKLRALAFEMLREIYLQERARDIDYYSYWEAKEDPEMILKDCLDRGVFVDRTAALAECEGDLSKLRKLPAVWRLGRILSREVWADEHDCTWASFDEVDTMWHGCSD